MRLGAFFAVFVVASVAFTACSADRVAPLAEDDSPSSGSSESPALASELTGRVAVGGAAGLQLLEPTGGLVAVVPNERARVSQPTWSRSGDRVVATVFGGGSGTETVVVTHDGDGLVSTEVRRPYFFYSWSSDGSRIAALGPGPLGTSLDVLDADGVPVSDVSVDAGSLYLAWEPGGEDLLVHTDEDLFLITEVDELRASVLLGSPGQRFLAPAWIPGTREALIVLAEADGSRLVRIEVDSGRQTDLGPVDGAAGIVVAPDGSRALVAHSDATAGSPTFASFEKVTQVADVTAATELIDLATGDRTVVSRSPSIWAEWSPDGSAIVLLQPSGSELEWFVWSGETLKGLGPFLPSPAFLQSYVLFAWQYVETPRVWAPDGLAIAYAASVEGRQGIFVHRLTDDSPVRISDGNVAFWSPG